MLAYFLNLSLQILASTYVQSNIEGAQTRIKLLPLNLASVNKRQQVATEELPFLVHCNL